MATAVTAAVVAVAMTAAPATADPVVDGQFAVSDVGTNNQIAAGPDGAVWVTLQGAKDVARIAPDGTVTEFDDPAVNNPIGITAGPDGNLWVTLNGAVARFAPANPAAMVTTPIADISDPRAITIGPDGNLWTASGNKVIRIPPATPATFTSFAATGVVGARWIARGSDGNLWVADFGGTQIVKVTTAGVGTAFPTGGGPQGIAAGADGQVAYSDPGTNPQTIGRITTVVETTAVPLTDPFGVAFGADGAYWFAQFAGNSVARLTPTGALTSVALPAGSGPRQITAGPNNTVWVTLDTAEKVARISGVAAPTPTPTPSPTVTPTPNPTPNPTTKLTKKPKKVVRRAKVRFRFTGTAGATFQCRFEMQKWRACTSPRTYRVKRGKHVFEVRAVLSGNVDASPAIWKFRRR